MSKPCQKNVKRMVIGLVYHPHRVTGLAYHVERSSLPPEDPLGVKKMSKKCQNFVKRMLKPCQKRWGSQIIPVKTFIIFWYILISLIETKAWLLHHEGVHPPHLPYHIPRYPFSTYIHIYLSIDLHLYVANHICIYLSTYLFILVSCYLLIFLSTNLLIYGSMDMSSFSLSKKIGC